MKHLLVIRLSAMGDVAITIPVLRAFVKQYPNVKLTVISRPFFYPFFKDLPTVNFFSIDLDKRHKGVRGLFRLFYDLKKLDIDAVADLHDVIRSKLIRRLFRLYGKNTVAIDKNNKQRALLTRFKNKVFKPIKPIIDCYVSVFEKLGYPLVIEDGLARDKPILDKQVVEICGDKREQWIGIAPFAQYESKIYPLDLMQEVVDALAELPYKIFLFGGGTSEIEKLTVLKKNYNNVVVIAGKLKLEQELNLIPNLDVMVSMDSGNAHIGAMLGIKVITLWGATHPYSGFKPFNQPLEYCLTADRDLYPYLPTSIYGNIMVKGYEEVMRTILPVTVVDKIKSVL